MDQPTTSTVIEKEQQIEVENIGPETTKLLKRIIRKVKLDQTSTTKSIPLNQPVLRTARYTGMNKQNVYKILALGESLKFEHIDIDRQIIHKQLMSIYFVRNEIPTITEFFNYLTAKLPIYVDLEYFTKILIKMDYVFYKFPKSKALRVMEKKTVTFERYRYLNNILKYREDKMPIAYVGVASVTVHNVILNLEKTLQTDIDDIASHVLFTVTGEKTENVKVLPPLSHQELQNSIKDWLFELFALKNLPTGTVFVLEDSKIFNEKFIYVPTWKSIKADMVEWLEEHNVPCNIDMPKADLLRLIETCTDIKKNTYIIDSIVDTRSYPILRLPQCINGLSIVPLVLRTLNDIQRSKIFRARPSPWIALIINMSAADLNYFSNMVQLEEKQQLEDDMKLDKVLDELVNYAKTSGIDKEDNEDDEALPIFSDSD